jgi:hypothetical protein
MYIIIYYLKRDKQSFNPEQRRSTEQWPFSFIHTFIHTFIDTFIQTWRNVPHPAILHQHLEV